MELVYGVWCVIGISGLSGIAIEYACEKRRYKIQDEIDRETLGEKYYEQLWGRGTWKNGK